MAVLVPTICAALTGTLSHIFYFRRGEHHKHGVRYTQAMLVFIASGTLFIRCSYPITWTHAFMQVFQLAISYLAGLYTSLLIYRTLLHPLHRFPGPFGGRVSGFWFSAQLTHRDGFKKLHRLHNRYGTFVRVGPSDLSIVHPKAVNAIYGPSSRCTKAAWYDLNAPMISLQTTRDRALHDERRRVWSAAFSDKLLRIYEQRIRVYRQKLVDKLMAMENQIVDIRKWFNLYSFDVMGDLAFGQGFESLDRGHEHWAVELLNGAADKIGLYFPVWFFLLFKPIPALTRDYQQFFDFCGERLNRRMKTEVDIPNISSALIAPLRGREPNERERNLLDGDAQLIVVAGSDTTSTTLSTIFYELVRNPEEIEKLRAELTPYVDENSPTHEFLHSKIAHLNHLNGVINEALRLYSPVPGALPRKTPPEGIEIDGVYIPGNMTVYCPQYVMARSELIYEKPCDFIPERWYKDEYLVKERSAFAPFTIGPYNCIGRPLALLNLRTTLARLIMTFDVKFAHGEDGQKFTQNARDAFILFMGELNLTFTKRR